MKATPHDPSVETVSVSLILEEMPVSTSDSDADFIPPPDPVNRSKKRALGTTPFGKGHSGTSQSETSRRKSSQSQEHPKLRTGFIEDFELEEAEARETLALAEHTRRTQSRTEREVTVVHQEQTKVRKKKSGSSFRAWALTTVAGTFGLILAIVLLFQSFAGAGNQKETFEAVDSAPLFAAATLGEERPLPFDEKPVPTPAEPTMPVIPGIPKDIPPVTLQPWDEQKEPNPVKFEPVPQIAQNEPAPFFDPLDQFPEPRAAEPPKRTTENKPEPFPFGEPPAQQPPSTPPPADLFPEPEPNPEPINNPPIDLLTPIPAVNQNSEPRTNLAQPDLRVEFVRPTYPDGFESEVYAYAPTEVFRKTSGIALFGPDGSEFVAIPNRDPLTTFDDHWRQFNPNRAFPETELAQTKTTFKKIEGLSRVDFQTLIEAPLLDFRVEVPQVVGVGDVVNLKFMVTNRGSAPATGAVFRIDLPEQFTHPAGKQLDYLIGDLQPGDTREAILYLTAVKTGLANNELKVASNGELTEEVTREITVQEASPKSPTPPRQQPDPSRSIVRIPNRQPVPHLPFPPHMQPQRCQCRQ